MTAQPHDLRSFFHQVGRFSGERALTSSPVDRPLTEMPVELLDDPVVVPVVADPMRPAGFVDGIQASLLVCYRSHRPVYLNYVAAGCGTSEGQLLSVRESLYVTASTVDVDWYEGLGVSIPLVELAEDRPDEIARVATSFIGDDRDDHERLLVDDLIDDARVPLVLDGSLHSRAMRPGLVGVVKTVRRRYLPDETLLWGMPAGFRSPRFKIPAGSQGCMVDRYSCYLRLHDARERGWDFALVRLEAFDPDLLEPLAALALSEKQSSRARDARFDRHLAAVRAVEDLLRARRPAVFTLR